MNNRWWLNPNWTCTQEWKVFWLETLIIWKQDKCKTTLLGKWWKRVKYWIRRSSNRRVTTHHSGHINILTSEHKGIHIRIHINNHIRIIINNVIQIIINNIIQIIINILLWILFLGLIAIQPTTKLFSLITTLKTLYQIQKLNKLKTIQIFKIHNTLNILNRVKRKIFKFK